MMVERIFRVLILEDNVPVAKEIIEFLSPECVIKHVVQVKEAIKSLHGFDCYVFDEVVPGTLLGHEILLTGIRDGTIRVPCIVMTGLANIDRLQKLYRYEISAFIDKGRRNWLYDLKVKILECAGTDSRAYYLRGEFAKRGALKNKFTLQIKLPYPDLIGQPTIEDGIKLIESEFITENDKRSIHAALIAQLKEL